MKSWYLNSKDLNIHAHRQIYEIEKLIKKEKLSIEEIGSFLPCYFTINWHMGILYMCRKSENVFHIENDEVVKMGYTFFDRYVDMESYKVIINLVSKCKESIFKGVPISYITKFKQTKLMKNNLFYTTSKMIDIELLLSIDMENNRYSIDNIEYTYDKEIMNLISTQKKVNFLLNFDINRFSQQSLQLDRILGSSNFKINKFNLFIKLSNQELNIIRLWIYGLSTVQIAHTMQISPKTVETHRKNIYRKLEIKSFFELLRFAEAFDLMKD